MDNFLEEYFRQKYREEEELKSTPGPVVTISREFGCQAKTIAKHVADQLNNYHMGIGQTQKWKIISKEIMEESAKELQTDLNKIEYIFDFENRSTVDDFFMSLTAKQYNSDWKVRDAVKNVVRSIANRGYAIIVGRAGAQITRDFEHSLHIRLVAPLKFRVNHIRNKYQVSEKVAVNKVKEMDENRKKLLSQFDKDTQCDHCYDVYYNAKYLTIDQITSDIIHLMQLKKLI